MPARKLTEAQVADIRSYLAAHRWRGAKRAIAAKHGITDTRTIDKALVGDYLRPHTKDRDQEKSSAAIVGLA